MACSSNLILPRSITFGIFFYPIGCNANEIMVFNTPLLCPFMCNFLGSGVTICSSGRIVTVGPVITNLFCIVLHSHSILLCYQKDQEKVPISGVVIKDLLSRSSLKSTFNTRGIKIQSAYNYTLKKIVFRVQFFN